MENRDLDELENKLWEIFEKAVNVSFSDSVASEARAMNRNAAGTIGLAIVAAKKERRESVELKSFPLANKKQ